MSTGKPDREARHAALLDRLADHVLDHGLAATSLRPLARAAGTSDRMLLYYFTDKDALIAALLSHLADRMRGLLDQSVAAEPLAEAELLVLLRARVLDDAFWPYMRLWLDLAAGAAGGNAQYRQVGEAIGRGFVGWLEPQIAAPDADARRQSTARLLTMIEGMVLLKALGLDDVGAEAV
ncbi:TetR/AcrR family transcriptional regulator [Sphingomonas sp. AX6]|uniref:TetR/AcrR family transcriptional regulator n=1 Tax=Sphingomonas sp. AX6 TaxID=2653171 RepID=UPI0012F33D01|nr:TetR/AcrR family transcriptional regulator [Sphingomonas sp. AX6]VXC41908.1 conserved hypothetical protein [Sphingomonas sp. AX6]